jgi:GDP-mannose 6-dehydrogenase
MNVSVFGLGYVGAVTAACLARDGHFVVGVDINPEKIEMISNGCSPVIEEGLESLLQEGINSGRLKATTKVVDAIAKTNISMICVGTPSKNNGALDLSFVMRVCHEIAEEANKKSEDHSVVIRSTVLPGTIKECENILKTEGEDSNISVAFNPEFLREGSAINDYNSPPYTIIGTFDKKAENVVKILYANIDAPFIVTEPAVAEMIKYTANAWHANKIAFTNEIGRIAKSAGVDGRKVMDIIAQDTKLNISPAYMKPGFAYGGSCLPKDLQALTYYAKANDIEVPLLNSIKVTNLVQIEIAINRILSIGKKNIGILGLAFKPGTDDLRESPSVELSERLIGKGCNLKILDSIVRKAKLMGSNKEYIEGRIPHLTSLLVRNAQELLEHSEVIVVTHNGTEFREVVDSVQPTIPIFDLTGLMKTNPNGKNYEGIAW